MLIKAKLRCIGNSLGIIIPANVITGRKKGNVITVDVITEKIADKTIFNNGENSSPIDPRDEDDIGVSIVVRPNELNPLDLDSLSQPSPLDTVEDNTADNITVEPQSYNPMKAGYVPSGKR